MKGLFKAGVTAAVLIALVMLWYTWPQKPEQLVLVPHVADLKNGEVLYNIGGCQSCHLPPEGSGIAVNVPAGGTPLPTPLGRLYPPNITFEIETGIGKWSESDFIIAMKRGIAPDGRAYIPAFPYMSYRNMSDEDLRDLYAFLKSIPTTANQVPEHDVAMLAAVRRGLVLWQKMATGYEPLVNLATETVTRNRGAYLVNGPGHCGECHTPRTVFMMSDLLQNLAGGPHPEGAGKVPSLRGLIARGRYKDVVDLATALQHGEAFGYDKLSSGGMGKVQANIAKLPESDIIAIATYLAGLK